MSGQSGGKKVGYDIEFSLPSLYRGEPCPPCPTTKGPKCAGVSCSYFKVGHRFFYPSNRHDPEVQPRCGFYGVGLCWQEVPLTG